MKWKDATVLPNNMNYRAVGAIESVSLHHVFDELVYGKDPFAEIGRLLKCARERTGSEFEQYAGSLFLAAGSASILEGALRRKLKLLAPGDGQLARIVASAPLGKSERLVVEATETALNRVVTIVDAIDDGIVEQDRFAERERINISFMGVSHPQSRAGYRSAQIILPPLKPGERASRHYYNEIDWRTLDSIASISRTLFQQCLTPNTSQAVFGTCAPNKSDWDVRTRLAKVLGGLELPFRCRFAFDCNIDTGTVAVRFDYPPASMVPETIREPHDGNEQDAEPTPDSAALARSAHEAFAIRFACLVAAACFGSGRDVQYVHLCAMDERWARPMLCCVFQRAAYVNTVLSSIDDNRFADASLRYDPEGLARLAGAEHLDWASSIPGSPRFLHRVTVPDDTMARQRIQPCNDDRALPDDAAQLFRSVRVADIDAMSYFGPHSKEIDEAKSDSDDSIMASILRLESLVDTLERELQAPDWHADARPLYCPHALARLAIVLLNDEMSVGAQAEAFLNSGSLDEPSDNDYPWYFRAPSALYHAHMGLSDLYQRMGDFEGSEQHANRCLALAPTAVDSYFRKADVLAERQLFTQAANVLIAGLRIAVWPSDCALLYYYLGLVMWNRGMKRHAAAIHTYNASLRGEFAEKSSRVVAGLRKRDDAPIIVHASPVAASKELMRLRIPVAPMDLRAQLAHATIALSCAGAPLAAAPYAAALAQHCRNDAAVAAACRSLQFGTTLE